MNDLLLGALLLALICLAWVSYRFFKLRQRLKEYSVLVKRASTETNPQEYLPTDFKNLEQLSNEVNSLARNNGIRLADLEAGRARLEATLTQMTDGVLIADAQGRIQMSNPAAEKLFGEGEILIGKTVSVALRHHILIETWRKCQQSRNVQSDSVEMVDPQRRQDPAGVLGKGELIDGRTATDR